MDVNKLMDTMKQRDDAQQRGKDLDEKLREKNFKLYMQKSENTESKARSNALLKSIESAFQEAESNLETGQRMQREGNRISDGPDSSSECVLLRKALAE